MERRNTSCELCYSIIQSRWSKTVVTVSIVHDPLSIPTVAVVLPFVHRAIAVGYLPSAFFHRIHERSHVHVPILVPVSSAALNYSLMPNHRDVVLQT